MNFVRKGDMIKVKSKIIVIRIIFETYYSDKDGWMIEGMDENLKYFMWKQWADGGELIQEKKGERR